MRFCEPTTPRLYSRRRPRTLPRLLPSRGGGRAGAWLALGLLSVFGPACGARGEPDEVASLPPPIVDPMWPDGGPGPCGQAVQSLFFVPRPVDVLVLFDRSGSMSRAFGASTRFDVAQTMLDDIVKAYETRIRFGFQAFPAPGGCGGDGDAASCCAQPPSVPVGTMHAEAIGVTMQAAAPVSGNTPTAEALRLAGLYFASLADGVEDRFVLLATDGQPSCRLDGTLGRDVVRSGERIEGPCLDALRQVQALRAVGVRVIVVGIGADLAMGAQGAPSCLEELARSGGAARQGAAGPSFFSASEPKDLERALQRIFGAVIQPSCTISMSRAAPDPANVAVFFDDQEIPYDPRGFDGWKWVEGSEGKVMLVTGASCQRLERLQVQNLDIRLGCEPCRSPGSCQ